MRRHVFVLTAVGMLVAGVARGESEEATSPTTATPVTTLAPTPDVGEQQEVVVEIDLCYLLDGEGVVERGSRFATSDDVTLTLDLYLPSDPSDAPIAIEPWYRVDLARAGAIVAAIDQASLISTRTMSRCAT